MEKTQVLIVDDSPMMCQFLTIFLEKRFEVIAFTNALKAAQSLYDGAKPELIVTDLNMPELDGEQFIKAARRVLPNVPILVVSGLNSSRDRIRSLEAGADDFLLKPFHPAELDVRLKKMMAKKGQTAAPQSLSIFKKMAQAVNF